MHLLGVATPILVSSQAILLLRLAGCVNCTNKACPIALLVIQGWLGELIIS